ncbi:dephospho-CoA kinase [Alphaproteobacteria bacterium]|nr:dephospho-CoA kinase [Alphaproteobacteria bacterium]
MIIIGLTGSVGMGKTQVCKYFKKMKIDVFDSDYQVKLLYEEKNIIKDIKLHFPLAFSNNKLSKKTLADIVFREEKKLKLLESLIHENLKNKQKNWIRKKIREKSKIVIFDVPLLYEKDNIRKYDFVIVVSCSKEIQKMRVLKRKNWNLIRLNYTLKKQLDDNFKKSMADIIIKTDRGKKHTLIKVLNIIKFLSKSKSRNINKVLSYFPI